jgi:hypothetical protein
MHATAAPLARSSPSLAAHSLLQRGFAAPTRHPAPRAAPPSTSRHRSHGVHYGWPKTLRQEGEARAYAWVYAGQLSTSPWPELTGYYSSLPGRLWLLVTLPFRRFRLMFYLDVAKVDLRCFLCCNNNIYMLQDYVSNISGVFRRMFEVFRLDICHIRLNLEFSRSGPCAC